MPLVRLSNRCVPEQLAIIPSVEDPEKIGSSLFESACYQNWETNLLTSKNQFVLLEIDHVGNSLYFKSITSASRLKNRIKKRNSILLVIILSFSSLLITTCSLNASAIGPIIFMQDTTASFGLGADSQRPLLAEQVTDSSALVGKNIDTIIIKLMKEKSPMGTVQVGVFNSDLSIKKLFGTIDTSSLNRTYKDSTFSLGNGQTYQIHAGDRLGIKFSGGAGESHVSIMTDQIGTFDGKNSYLTYFADCTSCNTPKSQWWDQTTKDLFMTLQGPDTSSDSTNSTGNGGPPVTPTISPTISRSHSENPVPSLVKPSFGDVPGMVFQDGLTIDGKVYDLNNYNVNVLKNIEDVGKTVTIVVKHQVFWGTTYWEHVAIGMNFGENKEFEMSSANLILSDDKNDGAQLTDSVGYIKDYKATTITDSNFIYTTFTFTVGKPMPDTNILITAFDYYHRVNYIHVHGALQFGQDPVVLAAVKPEWIHEYGSLEAADEAVFIAGYYKPQILGHVSNPSQMFDNPSQGTIRWFFDEKNETLSRVIYDGSGGIIQSYVEPLENRYMIPMTERSYSGQHLELWSWQDYQELFQMVGH
jgi:hypothetical protein